MRRGERPNFPIIGPWEKMLVGSPWGMWHRHPGIISIVESIPRWLQLVCFAATQAELECVADSLSSWSGTEAEVSSLCVSYCILPLPGRSPGLKVVYIISTVPWAQCKQFRVSVISTHRIFPATARPGLAVLCGFPDLGGSQDHQSVNDEERTRAEFLETLTWYDDVVWH